jgi:cation diffusion facilitator family transporter
MTQPQRHRTNTITALVAIVVAFTLAMVKFAVALFSGSIALFASAVDSWLDFMITVVNFFTIRQAAKPPDADHAYGHGKFEAYAELLQGLFIAFSGGYLAFKSIERLINGGEITAEYLGVAVMAGSIVASFLLVRYLQAAVKKTNSLVLKAEAANFSSDMLANLAVIGGLIVVRLTGLEFFDPLISLAIALYILRSAWQLLAESHEVLTDKEMPKRMREELIGIIEHADPRVAGWHLLRTRQTGTERHIDFHLLFRENLSLTEAHEVTEKLELLIRNRFADSIVLIHMEPTDNGQGHK